MWATRRNKSGIPRKAIIASTKIRAIAAKSLVEVFGDAAH